MIKIALKPLNNQNSAETPKKKKKKKNYETSKMIKISQNL